MFFSNFWAMNTYVISLAVIGIAALGMAWMPSISEKTKVSYAILYVLIGVVLYSLLGKYLPAADPMKYEDVTIHLTELVVIVSIMGTGLKIDQPFSLKTWRVPFRLISITMLLCIGSLMLLGQLMLGFNMAAALLLGAVMAPTDPVLASDVQVGPPMEEDKDNVRFSLTAEAGMNDGVAFPFTWLAISLAMMVVSKSLDIWSWLGYDMLYRIVAGVGAGFLMGRALAYLVFYLPYKKNFIVIRDGFVGISTTLMVYGLTELIHGYGFIAVFVTAITLRNFEIGHKLHKHLHDFTDQVERILVAIVLILFGGSLVSGILDELTWPMVGVAFIFLFIIRPLSGLIGLIGTKLHIKEKLAISFFGIRGIGSFFYLSFGLKQYFFMYEKELWSLVSFIILLSILIHGVSASTVMTHLKDRFSEKNDAG
jgi:NhaP-type Na+/H+ or K+/H+ antiporter